VRQGRRGERKEERKRYDSDAPLATTHPALFLHSPFLLFSLSFQCSLKRYV